jgi:nucleoid DNA-binding protein
MATPKKTASNVDDVIVEIESASEDTTPQSMMIRKKEFIERIVTETGAKRSDVRLISDAVLKVLGDTLSSGEGFALPPLGRARIARQIDKTGGEVLVIKLRRNTPSESNDESNVEDDGKTSEEALADKDE